MEKIYIQKSPTADTRTCDYKTVTLNTLLDSSRKHIRDVRHGMEFWAERLVKAGERHDMTKLSRLAWFHKDFGTGFKEHGWWDMHRVAERHHLGQADGVPEDVNLVDVLEYITDCVMAGKARSGEVYEIGVDPEVLMRAFKSTVKLLTEAVVVEGPEVEGQRVFIPELKSAMVEDPPQSC